MKKATRAKTKRTVKKIAKDATSTARSVAANAFLVGRGIVRGAQQGIKDVQAFDKRGKRKG